MKIRRLKTVLEIITVIGRARLYEMLGCTSQQVTNWIRAGRFPPNTYVAISTELDARGCDASDRLWGMIEHKRARAA